MTRFGVAIVVHPLVLALFDASASFASPVRASTRTTKTLTADTSEYGNGASVIWTVSLPLPLVESPQAASAATAERTAKNRFIISTPVNSQSCSPFQRGL